MYIFHNNPPPPNILFNYISGSARCSPRTNTTTNSKKNISNREKELWNPEKAAAQLIGLQLQNPHTAQQNLLCLVGGKLKQTNTNLNNIIGQSPRPFRKQSGQFCSFDLDFRIYEKRKKNFKNII